MISGGIEIKLIRLILEAKFGDVSCLWLFYAVTNFYTTMEKSNQTYL